jgi:ribosomal protein L12E/L44/L45/RPP1/RPP2
LVKRQSTIPEELTKRFSIAIRTGVYASAVLLMRGLGRSMDSASVAKYMDKGVTDYIAAVGALALSGRDIDKGNIVSVVEAAGIIPDKRLLDAVRTLHYRNSLLYVNAVYFLNFLGQEPTIERVLAIVRTVRKKPDATLAGYVIEYCKEYEAGKYSAFDMALQNDTKQALFKQTYALILDLTDVMADIAIGELSRTLKDPSMTPHMGPRLFPYIGALGSLAFSGKDMTKKNIRELLDAAGIKTDDELLDAVASVNFKNNLAYVIAMYFLLTVGIKPETKLVNDVVRAIGFTPDATSAGYVLKAYRDRSKLWGPKE